MIDTNSRKMIGFRELKQYIYQVYNGKSEAFKAKILAIILFTLGIFLLWSPLGLNNKIGITLVFIAIFLSFFYPEERSHNNIEAYIFLFLIGWLIIMSLITINGNLDVFFISVVFGMLIVKEFANGYLTSPWKKKLSILTLVFFSLSMVLIAERIISFFSMK